MQLRNYQQDLINQARLAFKNGYKHLLCVLPCGGGKTACFAYMAENHIKKSTDNYVWFLVHRQELIEQTINTFEKFNIKTDNVLIAMVQSVSRNIPKYHKPTLIIFDEAHHSTASQWSKIINYYNNVPIVGLTATPCRTNNSNLGDIYDKLIVGASSEYLLKNGYLAQYDYYAPKLIAPPDMRGSDYDVTSIVYESKIYGDVLKYIDYNRKTIIYCPNIKFSLELQKQIPYSVHFDGNTDKKTREKIISDFRAGVIRVLLNVDLIGEGFDVPDCDCVILLRPTQSLALYIQQSMRCLRPNEDKRAVIYDLVGNVFRHGLPTENREWSLKGKIKVRNKAGVPDVITRMCNKCYRVYSGTNRICPYCGFDNGKTEREIEQDKQAELEKITELEKKHKRIEVGMCKGLSELIALAKKRGYKNPKYWANMVLKGRRNRI